MVYLVKEVRITWLRIGIMGLKYRIYCRRRGKMQNLCQIEKI